MYSNNTNCDLYIGTGAGKKLLEEIERARTSVKIVSPYISAPLIDHLINLHRSGVSIELITSENDSTSEILRKLVRQSTHIDPKAARLRKRLATALWVLYLALAISAYNAYGLFFGHKTAGWYPAVVLIFFFGMLTIALHWWRSSIRVKFYSYDTLFAIRILKSRNEVGKRTTYLHSKIYIIDDQVAYLGSLNFTHGGTQANHETRIRIKDTIALAKINEEFESLWDDAALTKVDLDQWGAQHFIESPR